MVYSPSSEADNRSSDHISLPILESEDLLSSSQESATGPYQYF